jgi:sialidase-1
MKNILIIISLLFLFNSCTKKPNIENKAEIVKNIVLFEEDGKYCAWPVMQRAANNDLVVIFCRAEEHHSPTGEIVQIRSTDNGNTWSKPVTIRNTPLDDRGGSLTRLKDGRLLAFLLSAYHPTKIFTEDFVKSNAYTPEVLKRWSEYTETKEYLDAKSSAGFHDYISSDNGNSWREIGTGSGSFHNSAELDSNILLMPYYGSKNDIILSRTDYSKELLTFTSDTLKLPSTKTYSFAEPEMLKLKSGRIIMMIRTTAINPYDNCNYKNILWETYSDDNGKTWVEPYPTPIWGFPAHLLQLSDGRILCSYGYRRVPFGERACISEDGITWRTENEIIIRDDAPNEDLGYPASVEIEQGMILTIYYQPNVPKGTIQDIKPPKPDRKKPGILGTFWKLPVK